MPLSPMQIITIDAVLNPVLEELGTIENKSILKKILQIMQSQKLDFIDAVALSAWKTGGYDSPSVLLVIRDAIEAVFYSKENDNQFSCSSLNPFKSINLVRAGDAAYPEILDGDLSKYCKEKINIALQDMLKIEPQALPSLNLAGVRSYKKIISSEAFTCIEGLKLAFAEQLSICKVAIDPKKHFKTISNMLLGELIHPDLESFLINLRSAHGNSMLHLAIKENDRKLVKYLIGKVSIDRDGGRYWNTPLMLSAIEGNVEIVKFLMKYGANKEVVDCDGLTAIMLASGSGHAGVVATLISAGANIEAVANNGFTALMLAASNGHLEVVKRLIEAGVNKEAVANDGLTALIIAAGTGYAEVVDILIKAGANKDAIDSNGWTALMFAAKNGYLGVVEKLIDSGVNIDAVNLDGSTALMIAARYGRLPVIAKFLKSSVDPMLSDLDGETALDYALDQGSQNLIKAAMMPEQANLELTAPENGGIKYWPFSDFQQGVIAGNVVSGLIKCITGSDPKKTTYDYAVDTVYKLGFSFMGMAVHAAFSKALASQGMSPLNQAIVSQMLSQLALNSFKGLSAEEGFNTAASIFLSQSGAAELYPVTTGFVVAAGADLLQLAYDLGHKACEMSGLCESV